MKDDLSDSGWRSCPAAVSRLHPKGCSVRTNVRTGDPSCSGPPLLPIHSCRPVIRAAAGLGVRPDRPAAAAGSCRQSGILAHGRTKIPTEPGICGVTHHSPVRVDATAFEEMARCPTSPGPAAEGSNGPTRPARDASRTSAWTECGIRRWGVRHSVRFGAAPDVTAAVRAPATRLGRRQLSERDDALTRAVAALPRTGRAAHTARTGVPHRPLRRRVSAGATAPPTGARAAHPSRVTAAPSSRVQVGGRRRLPPTARQRRHVRQLGRRADGRRADGPRAGGRRAGGCPAEVTVGQRARQRTVRSRRESGRAEAMRPCPPWRGRMASSVGLPAGAARPGRAGVPPRSSGG